MKTFRERERESGLSQRTKLSFRNRSSVLCLILFCSIFLNGLKKRILFTHHILINGQEKLLRRLAI